jgi:plastocyanin
MFVLSCLLASSALGAELAGNVHVSSRPPQYAVVWLDAPKAPPFVQASRITLDQRNISFVPRVLVVRVGSVVDFPNDDTVFHNVFSFRDGKQFDLGMYPTGTTKPIVFDKPGLSRIFCNIHPNMAAYVMAVETPYFAVSDEHGAFTIAGVPNGTYTYHAWRPGGETLTGSVTVDSSHALEIQW